MAEVTQVRPAREQRLGRVAAFREGFSAAYSIVKRVNFVLLVLAAAAIFAMNFFTIWEVYTRYALRDPATWTYPVTSYLLLYTIYLATAFTLYQGGHVRVEIVVESLPQKLRILTERLAHLLGLAFILIFLWQGWRLADRAIRDGERDISMLAVPLSITTIAIPIGLAMMAITYLFIIIESFLGPAPAEPRKEPPEITEI